MWQPHYFPFPMDRSAYESFHETLRRYQPPDVDPKMLAEVRKVVEQARRDLLG